MLTGVPSTHGNSAEERSGTGLFFVLTRFPPPAIDFAHRSILGGSVFAANCEFPKHSDSERRVSQDLDQVSDFGTFHES